MAFALIGIAAIVDMVMPQPQPVCLGLLVLAFILRECVRIVGHIQRSV